MSDYTDLQKAAEYAAQDVTKFADEGEEMRALQQFHEEVDPETVLVLIAENQALKGPHDWLAEDLIKELVDNAQAIQENADDGEEDEFVIVLLAAAQRIRRQEANIEKLKADVVLSAKAADCWDRLNIQNKALSDSFRNERDQLRAEVAGLRTGYEAYEQVNAELKAEVDRLNEEYDKAWRHDLNDKKNVQALAAEVARLSADSEALRKDAERYRMVRGIASISAGRRHLVVKRLPVNGFGSSTARDFDASIDAALGQGEQS